MLTYRDQVMIDAMHEIHNFTVQDLFRLCEIPTEHIPKYVYLRT